MEFGKFLLNFTIWTHVPNNNTLYKLLENFVLSLKCAFVKEATREVVVAKQSFGFKKNALLILPNQMDPQAKYIK